MNKSNSNMTNRAVPPQWRSVEDELPEESERVLCLMKSNGAIVSGYITKRWHDYPEVATDTDFHFEDYGGYECTHWMPIPGIESNPLKA